MQAFIDDSGVKGTDRHFVLAGQIATAVMWGEFSDAWKAALQQPPGIEYFKMWEAVHLKEQFRPLSPQQRDEKLLKLALVIARYGFTAIHCTTELQPFQEAIGDRVQKPFRDPYFAPFHIMVFSVCQELRARGQDRPFEIFFDEHKIFGPRAKAFYPVVRALLSASAPESAKILPVEPHFTTDAIEMPLQSADMLAWFFRRRAPGANRNDNQFDWLLPKLFTVPVSDFSSVFVRP